MLGRTPAMGIKARTRRDKPARCYGWKSQTLKGIATHSGPESCGHGRKDVPEALTGERVGRVLSRERIRAPGAHAV
jgi:hypothetical protein